MPDERLITEIESLLAQVVALGGENERSQMVPNLTVQDASPTGLTGFVIVSDDRDGDNILAKKVPSVIYSNNDLVNVLFPKGGEAIAFQQGSQSANGGIWEIVPSTSTDIFYDKGNVGIGNSLPSSPLDVTGFVTIDTRIQHKNDTDTYMAFSSDQIEFFAGSISLLRLRETIQDTVDIGDVAGSGNVNVSLNDGQVYLEGVAGQLGIGIGEISPSAKVEILDTAGPQLQLTFEDGVKFTDFTVDTNHNLTITPTSTGQIILQPTTDSTDFFQVLDSDGGTPIINVDATNEFVGIGTASPDSKLVVSNNSWIGPAAVSGNTVQGASYMEEGLVINSDSEKEMLTFKDAAIAHGMTSLAETDTFGALQVFSGGLGGFALIGYSEDDSAMLFIGRATDDNVDKSSTAFGPFVFNAQKKNGTTIGSMGAEANIGVFRNNGITVWLVDEDGDTWQSGSITLATDIIHLSDPDTKISFTPDDIEFTAGNLSMLKLTETTQDLITLGPGSGDVDINFNGDMFLEGSSGNFGIGNISPSFELDITGDARIEDSNKLYFGGTGAADQVISMFGSTVASFRILTLQAEQTNNSTVLKVSPNGTGTAGIPAVLEFYGTDGVADSTNYERLNIRSGTTYKIFTDQGGTGTVRDLSIYTENNTDQLYLNANGRSSFGGVTSPLGKLHVDQSSTTAAIPALYLDQADVSEEMFEFNTTIGVGNAIEAVGAKTLTPTHFIKCTLPGGLTRYWEVGTIS